MKFDYIIALDEDLIKAHVHSHFRKNPKTGKLEFIPDYDNKVHAADLHVSFQKGDKVQVTSGKSHAGKEAVVQNFDDKKGNVRVLVDGKSTGVKPDNLKWLSGQGGYGAAAGKGDTDHLKPKEDALFHGPEYEKVKETLKLDVKPFDGSDMKSWQKWYNAGKTLYSSDGFDEWTEKQHAEIGSSQSLFDFMRVATNDGNTKLANSLYKKLAAKAGVSIKKDQEQQAQSQEDDDLLNEVLTKPEKKSEKAPEKQEKSEEKKEEKPEDKKSEEKQFKPQKGEFWKAEGNGHGKILAKKVEGESVELAAAPGHPFFAYRAPSGGDDKGKWFVVDQKSGLAAGEGETKAEAIEHAEKVLQEQGSTPEEIQAKLDELTPLKIPGKNASSDEINTPEKAEANNKTNIAEALSGAADQNPSEESHEAAQKAHVAAALAHADLSGDDSKEAKYHHDQAEFHQEEKYKLINKKKGYQVGDPIAAWGKTCIVIAVHADGTINISCTDGTKADRQNPEEVLKSGASPPTVENVSHEKEASSDSDQIQSDQSWSSMSGKEQIATIKAIKAKLQITPWSGDSEEYKDLKEKYKALLEEPEGVFKEFMVEQEIEDHPNDFPFLYHLGIEMPSGPSEDKIFDYLMEKAGGGSSVEAKTPVQTVQGNVDFKIGDKVVVNGGFKAKVIGFEGDKLRIKFENGNEGKVDKGALKLRVEDKKKVPLDETKLPVKAEDLPVPHDFNNWNGQGKGLSSSQHYNDMNAKAEQDILDFAREGNLVALKNYEYIVVNKDTGTEESKKSIASHPSQHVQAFWSECVSALDQIVHPSASIFQEDNIIDATVDDPFVKSGYLKFGTSISSVTSEKRFGFWLKLAHALNVDDLIPEVKEIKVSSIMDASKAWYANIPSILRHFIQKVQASGSYNDAFRDGKDVTSDGKSTAKMTAQAYAHAVSLPEGSEIYKWLNIPNEMQKLFLGAPKGAILQNPGSMCCSVHPTATSHFGPHRLKIRYAAGAKALNTHGTGGYEGEQEITTLPGARFMIISAKKGNSKSSTNLDIELLMLPPASGYVADVSSRSGKSKKDNV